MSESRVLIVTGGLITGQESSLFSVARKLLIQTAHAQHAWLDHRIKLVMGEPIIGLQIERFWNRLRQALPQTLRRTPHSDAINRFFQTDDNAATPSLTEVALMTGLAQEGLCYDTLTLDALFSNFVPTQRVLERATCVFLSTTYLHDLSELEPVLARLRGGGRRIVVGGALMGAIHASWDGLPGIDLVAVGYGEYLAAPIARWIRSDYKDLQAPPRGRIVQKAHSPFLFSGVPETKNLDDLPTPDWSLAERYHKHHFPMIYYESVRGCPYRCSFCNYPYLFDDKRFRFKSAQKIADDWQRYSETLGIRYITCLDSLFTMPKRRLLALCDLLIKRNLPIKWICYARADDLADSSTVALMKAAGAYQVQIGIESGDQGQLDRMNKACSVESNHQALINCRSHGLTSVISLIVGYPGETTQTLENTYQFMKATPPDFYFLATFSTRVANVPMLQSPLREQFGLQVDPSLHSMAPYWRHDTMSCVEVGEQLRNLDQRLMQNKVALNASLFFKNLLNFEPSLRKSLLDLQARATHRPLFTKFVSALGKYMDRRMDLDLNRISAFTQ